MPDDAGRDKWFTAMLAIIIVLLGGLGTLTIVLNSQTWDKLNRMTALFLHERDMMNDNISKLCDKVGTVSERVTRVEATNGNGAANSNGVKKK